MYTGERDLTEVIRNTAPHSLYYHTIDKRKEELKSDMIRRGYYFPRCVRCRESAGLSRKKGCEVDCGYYRAMLNSSLTPRTATTDRLTGGDSGPCTLL